MPPRFLHPVGGYAGPSPVPQFGRAFPSYADLPNRAQPGGYRVQQGLVPVHSQNMHTINPGLRQFPGSAAPPPVVDPNVIVETGGETITGAPGISPLVASLVGGVIGAAIGWFTPFVGYKVGAAVGAVVSGGAAYYLGGGKLPFGSTSPGGLPLNADAQFAPNETPWDVSVLQIRNGIGRMWTRQGHEITDPLAIDSIAKYANLRERNQPGLHSGHPMMAMPGVNVMPSYSTLPGGMNPNPPVDMLPAAPAPSSSLIPTLGIGALILLLLGAIFGGK